MNLTKFTLLLVTSTVAMISLSACTDENAEERWERFRKNWQYKVTQQNRTYQAWVAGEKLVNNLCSQCHGDKNHPLSLQSYPNIKGQKSSYVLKQLRDFKVMHVRTYTCSRSWSLYLMGFTGCRCFLHSTLKPLDLYERSPGVLPPIVLVIHKRNTEIKKGCEQPLFIFVL